MKDPQTGQKPPLLEVIQHLDQLAHRHPGDRLLVDMARDAVTEAARQQAALLSANRRLRRQRDREQTLLDRTLDAVAASAAVVRPGTPFTDALHAEYRALKTEVYPETARRLHEVAGKGEARDLQLIMVEQVMRPGQRTLLEALLLKPDADRADLRRRLADHVGKALLRRLTRKAGCRVNPEAGAKVDALILRSLELIDGLLSTDPSVRLTWPAAGEPFDAHRHERVGGKVTPDRVIRAVLFPGLRGGDVAERALVATQSGG